MTTAKEIRAAIKKEFNLNARQVSVKTRQGGYEQCFQVALKVRGVDFTKFREFCQGLSEVDRCEASGEVLAGGNTFVLVETDAVLRQEIRELDEYKALIEKVEDDVINSLENNAQHSSHTYNFNGKEFSVYVQGYTAYARRDGQTFPIGHADKRLVDLTLVNFILNCIEGA